MLSVIAAGRSPAISAPPALMPCPAWPVWHRNCPKDDAQFGAMVSKSLGDFFKVKKFFFNNRSRRRQVFGNTQPGFK
jgi:hypothetical protein